MGYRAWFRGKWGNWVNNNKNPEHRQAVLNYMDYLASAQARFAEALNGLTQNRFSDDLRKPARMSAHKIAGNALMYGFAALGDLARDAEKFLMDDAELNAIHGQAVLLKLLNHIDDIRSQARTPEEPEFESASFQRDPTHERWNDSSFKTEDFGLTSHRSSVLLIHSDSWMRDLITNMLEPDTEVFGCEFAYEAMSAAVNNTPDLILVQQDLSDMSGIDVTRFIRNVEELAHTPVVMIMSSDDPEDVVAAVQAGVTDCFDNDLEVLPIINHVKDLLKKTQYEVFIVDDDAAVRDLLKQRFENYGMRVQTANDGIEAIEYLRTNKPDLIILDRMMPRLEGGAVLYQIQQEVNLKSIPVMLVTAMTNRNDVITWLKRGATDYITKPFNPDEVVLRALRHLRIEKDAA